MKPGLAYVRTTGSDTPVACLKFAEKKRFFSSHFHALHFPSQMIVSDKVEKPVHKKFFQFLVERYPVLCSLTFGLVEVDHDISQYGF